MLDIPRREFIALVGGGGLLLTANATRARAQQPTMPVVGLLDRLADAVDRQVGDAGFPEECHPRQNRLCAGRRPS
jgi:hypothetical protein